MRKLIIFASSFNANSKCAIKSTDKDRLKAPHLQAISENKTPNETPTKTDNMATDENNKPLGGEEEVKQTPLEEYLELRRRQAEVAEAIAKKLRKMMQEAERLAQDTRNLIELLQAHRTDCAMMNLAAAIEYGGRQLEWLQALEETMLDLPAWSSIKFKSFVLIKEDGGKPREMTGDELAGIITALHKLRSHAASNGKDKTPNTITE